MSANGANNSGGVEAPLSGVRVLELGRLIAAPFCGQLLADLGAEVIKVERPGRGDESRHYGPPFLPGRAEGEAPSSPMFLSTNRNKRSLTLDFGQAEGRDILLKLAAGVDVFIENFKPGVLDRYGLGADQLRAINPALIYTSVTGFGATGPYADRAATDIIVQGMSGLMRANEEREPQKVGVAVMDMFTGLYAAIGVLAALRHRDARDGGGQNVAASLLDCGLAQMAGKLVELSLRGEGGKPAPRPAPSAIFRCIGGDLNVQASGDRDFGRLCEVLRQPGFATDPRYGSRADRSLHGDRLHEELAPIFAQREYEELYAALTAAGVMCSPVYDTAGAFDDPHVRVRARQIQVRHSSGADIPLVRNPLEFSVTPLDRYAPPPALGEHSEEILADQLGFSPAELSRLRAAQVI